ncbi:MAG: serine/threonine protein kinase [Phycisphaerales bacterium]|nr:MAG: serine/threonine protein kinase [Phycisphaerales bacterium]
MNGEGPSDEVPEDSAAHDAELIDAARREVERTDKPEGPVLVPPVGPGDARPAFTGPPPDSFTGYTIAREIHRGGQGVVYQAIQESTNRKVAIKVMREGPFAGPADRARFEREVRILGQLNHPNIVAIHDTGSAAGSFYFVMDYVGGQPLDVYMASRVRSVDETLRLFGKVCEAVNAAHLRGIIHRDLKPGNIRIDAEGGPHILDFGLAKVVTSEAEASKMTMTGQFIGSLPWASPEQAEGAPGKIDVRTDVYSLGVILYQMLTGKFPYEVMGNIRDVLDRIMKAEPARPSAIRRQINDEVETIVLKCLSKDRERRYQSAGELRRDIGHYLKHEPIEAKRDSTWYVFRKSLRRYRAVVSVAVAFVVLLAGSAVSMWLMYRRARTEAQTVGQVVEFLQKALTEADPYVTDKSNQTLRGLLDYSAQRIETEPIDSPLVRASVQQTLGASYFNLGELEQAGNHLLAALKTRRALLGEDHPDVAESQSGLAGVRGNQGHYDEAESLLRDAIAVQRRLEGPERLSLARSMGRLAIVLMNQGILDEAQSAAREFLQLVREIRGDTHTETATALNILSILTQEKGDYAGAEPLLRQALQIDRAYYGSDHVRVARDLQNLSILCSRLGDHAAAEQHGREALAIQRRVHGEENPALATSMDSLAYVLTQKGDTSAARPLLEQALALRLQQFGESHPLVAASWLDLAESFRLEGDYAAAEEPARKALAICRQTLGDSHVRTAKAMADLGELLRVSGRLEEAAVNLTAALDVQREAFGDEHNVTLETVQRLVALYEARGMPDQADVYRAMLPPPNHSDGSVTP